MGFKKKRSYVKQRILVIIFSFTLLNQLCLASESVKNDTGSDGKTKGETIAGNITGGGGRVQGRSVSSLLRSWDPIGVWKSASQMVQKGVRVFRESLHEGVKVASMLKDDVDEGVTHIFGQNTKHEASQEKHKDEDDTHLIEDASEKVTEDSASEPETTPADNLLYSSTARGGMFGGILRFMNVDSSRLGVIALNILIFFAEMITSSLVGKHPNSIPEARALKQGVMEWVVNGESPILQRFVKDATTETLPESLIETLKRRTGNNTACVQLLVCKMSPIIWGFQKTVEKKLLDGKSEENNTERRETPRSFWSTSANLLDDLMTSFPSKDGFVKFGNNCEQRFPNCRLLKFKKA